MKITMHGRRTGKTVQLIVDSKDKGYAICSPTEERIKQIIDLANKIGIDIQEPTLYGSKFDDKKSPADFEKEILGSW